METTYSFLGLKTIQIRRSIEPTALTRENAIMHDKNQSLFHGNMVCAGRKKKKKKNGNNNVVKMN